MSGRTAANKIKERWIDYTASLLFRTISIIGGVVMAFSEPQFKRGQLVALVSVDRHRVDTVSIFQGIPVYNSLEKAISTDRKEGRPNRFFPSTGEIGMIVSHPDDPDRNDFAKFYGVLLEDEIVYVFQDYLEALR